VNRLKTRGPVCEWPALRDEASSLTAAETGAVAILQLSLAALLANLIGAVGPAGVRQAWLQVVAMAEVG
jgi:hypothetical protein